MAAIQDLEVGIHRSGPGTFSVSVRQSSDVSETYEIDVVSGEEDSTFSLEIFRGRFASFWDRTDSLLLGDEASAYGQALWDAFFAGKVEERLRESYAGLLPDERLRLRLFLGPSALDLHELLWELLPDPSVPPEVVGSTQSDASPDPMTSSVVTIATSERIIFSRYLSSQQWHRVQLRRKDELRALIVIANPSNLSEWSGSQPGVPLSAVDVEGELARATYGLQQCGAVVDSLPSGGSATLARIASKLAEGYDILYLVCHGQRPEGQPPQLWLEHEDGTADVVAGSRLVNELRRLEQQPRLIVLASCMSAGGAADTLVEDRGALTAVGPLLAGIGVPAVLAMQGNFTMESLEEFMPAFFSKLGKSGRVDQAVAAARAAIEHRLDSWMPILFMRLRTGRLWYEPGIVFQTPRQSDVAWDSLVTAICRQRCTVILGSGMLDSIVGSQRTIAQRWAQKRKFPLDPSELDDLPQVAQYVATQEGNIALREYLRDWMWDEMWDHFSDVLPASMRKERLSDVMSAIGRHLRQTHEREPHKVLAQLPFPLYITTNPDNILVDALDDMHRCHENQKDRLCPDDRKERSRAMFSWHQDKSLAHNPDEVANGSTNLDDPTWDNPLVYHLFGHFSDPSSILLSEDDYFDYLIKATTNKAYIPPLVRDALVDRTLLFVGFQLTDWDFRVLLRLIANQPGGRLGAYPHVAVQVDPDEDRVQDTNWIRRYIEKYFQSALTSTYPTVFWGSTADFVGELHDRWIAAYGALPDYPMDFQPDSKCSCDPRSSEKTRTKGPW